MAGWDGRKNDCSVYRKDRWYMRMIVIRGEIVIRGGL